MLPFLTYVYIGITSLSHDLFPYLPLIPRPTSHTHTHIRWRQRTVLNEFLRNTEVSRVDKPSEYFQFTENFHGNAPLEVLSLVRRPSSQLSPTYEYEKVMLGIYTMLAEC